MNLLPLKHMGELQVRIIKHLAQNPDLSKTEIAQGLGYTHPGNVSKQTSVLEKKQLIRISSTYMARGSKRKRWSLTAKGISYFIEQSEYSIQELIQIIYIYKDQESAELLYNLIETMKTLGVSPNRVLNTFFKNNEQIFSSIRGTGTALLILKNMIVREIWEAPIYEKDIGDSYMYVEYIFLRKHGEPCIQEQYNEDIFDWIIRTHISKVDDFDTFASNCSQYFPLVFNNWNRIKQHSLDLWVKTVLENVMKHIHIKTIEQLATDIKTRYTHQDFIEDLYTYIYGPFIYAPDSLKENIPYRRLQQFITSTPAVKQFIVKRVEVINYGLEVQKSEVELYERLVLRTPTR